MRRSPLAGDLRLRCSPPSYRPRAGSYPGGRSLFGARPTERLDPRSSPTKSLRRSPLAGDLRLRCSPPSYRPRAGSYPGGRSLFGARPTERPDPRSGGESRIRRLKGGPTEPTEDTENRPRPPTARTDRVGLHASKTPLINADQSPRPALKSVPSDLPRLCRLNCGTLPL